MESSRRSGEKACLDLVQNPSGDDYYSYACGKAESYNEIPYRIRDEILKLSNINDEWIEQRNKAVTALALKNFDENYQKLLEKVPDDTKLRLLTYQTHPERAYAVKVASGLLRKGIPADTVAEMLKDKYPELAAYMSDDSGLDQSIDSYLKEYRTSKLKIVFQKTPDTHIPLTDLIPEQRLFTKLRERTASRSGLMDSEWSGFLYSCGN